MSVSPKIVFFGNERLSSGFDPHGAPTLEALIAADYNVTLVVANYERGQGRNARKLEIQAIAEAHNIPVALPKKLSDVTEQLAASQATIGVLVAYGKIIPQSIIGMFPRGIINIHPSLLPQYRGPTPIEQAILDGTPKTGVSLMQLVQKMDAGPVYAQSELPLTGSETKQELTQQLLRLGGQLLIEHLPAIVDGSARPTPQDNTKATYTTLLGKQDGVLDFTKPAAVLERSVRALAGWPKSRATIFGQDIIVQTVRTANSATDGALVMPCGGTTYLEILTLTAPSGRTATGADFIRGYKK